MTGEQKPGGLVWRVDGMTNDGKPVLVTDICDLNHEAVWSDGVTVTPLTPAEPAEARIRSLEVALAAAQNADAEATAHLRARATAAEAKLARAVEALRMARDPLSTAKMWAKRKGGCDGAIDKIDRSLFAIKQTLAALQQGNTDQ